MNSQQAFSKAVGEYLEGNLAAQRLLAALRAGSADPDLIYHQLTSREPHAGGEYARGLLRQLQKVLEREAHHG